MANLADLRDQPFSDNPYVAGLLGDLYFRPGYVISVALQADPGDFGLFGGAGWASTGARRGFEDAAAAWSAVGNVAISVLPDNYQPGGNRSTYTWVEVLEPLEDGLLGEHFLPGTDDLGGSFNNADSSFTAVSNSRGGYGFLTFLHEIGHGLGLDHPFDGTAVFPGVDGEEDFGDSDLNSLATTVMTYNDSFIQVIAADPEIQGSSSGWAPFASPSDNYGWAKTPMAFDIAAIQFLYGANMSTGAGDTVYLLPTQNVAGTGWICIWDGGGIDTISAAGAVEFTRIDLRPATLLSNWGGGGWMSRVNHVFGGFTIANGVTIENAIGSINSDTITGNTADNNLSGGAGNDNIWGWLGNDTIDGGDDGDSLWGGDGNDIIEGASGSDHLFGGDGSDQLSGGNDYDQIEGDAGSDTLRGGEGTDQLWGGDGDDTLSGDAGDDGLFGGSGNDTLLGGAGDDFASFSGNRADYRILSEGAGFRITDLRTTDNEGSDYVQGVERLVFADLTSLPATDNFRLLASDGFAGTIGGSGDIFGSAGFQDLTVLDLFGNIELDGSFNRGGDILRLPGDAINWNAQQSGSGVKLSDGDTEVMVPAGPTGLAIVFDDGPRVFRIDAIRESIVLGGHSIGELSSPVLAPPDETPLPTGANASAQAQLLLTEFAQVTAGGRLAIFGTAEAEEVRLLAGTATLDGSFNRGGDRLILEGPASTFTARAQGSAIVLHSAATNVQIPVGIAGITIEFGGDDARTLVFNPASEAILIGVQQIGLATVPLAPFA